MNIIRSHRLSAILIEKWRVEDVLGRWSRTSSRRPPEGVGAATGRVGHTRRIFKRIAPAVVNVRVVPGDAGRSIHREDWETCAPLVSAAGEITGARPNNGTADRAFTRTRRGQIDGLGKSFVGVDPHHRGPTCGGRKGGILLGLGGGEAVIDGGVIGRASDRAKSMECKAVLVAGHPGEAGVGVDPPVGRQIKDTVLAYELSPRRGKKGENGQRGESQCAFQ